MQVIGYALGVGEGQMLGEVAAYVGFVLLAFVLLSPSSPRPRSRVAGSDSVVHNVHL
jgi:hypothetical protein